MRCHPVRHSRMGQNGAIPKSLKIMILRWNSGKSQDAWDLVSQVQPAACTEGHVLSTTYIFLRIGLKIA